MAYARVAPTRFPKGTGGDAADPSGDCLQTGRPVEQCAGVVRWGPGGIGPDRRERRHTPHVRKQGRGDLADLSPNTPREQKIPLAWGSFATPLAVDNLTYGYRFGEAARAQEDSTVTLPEYYRQSQEPGASRAGLSSHPRRCRPRPACCRWNSPGERTQREPYVTPDGKIRAGSGLGRLRDRSRSGWETAVW